MADSRICTIWLCVAVVLQPAVTTHIVEDVEEVAQAMMDAKTEFVDERQESVKKDESMKEVICRHHPSIPLLCSGPRLNFTAIATVLGDALVGPASKDICGVEDDACCQESTCYGLPFRTAGCDERRGVTDCVGDGVNLTEGVQFKRGICRCLHGSCNAKGKCPDAPLAHLVSPRVELYSSSEGQKVPRESIEGAIAVAFLASCTFAMGLVVLGFRACRRSSFRRSRSKAVKRYVSINTTGRLLDPTDEEDRSSEEAA